MAPRVFRKRSVLSRLRMFRKRRLARLFRLRPIFNWSQSGWTNSIPDKPISLGEFSRLKQRSTLSKSLTKARLLRKTKNFDRQGYVLWWLRKKFKKFGVTLHSRRMASSLIHVNKEYRDSKRTRRLQKRKHKPRVNYLLRRIKRWRRRKSISVLSKKIKRQAVLKEGGEPLLSSKRLLSQIITNLPLGLKNKVTDHGERLSPFLKNGNIRSFFLGRVGRFTLSSFLTKKKLKTNTILSTLPAFSERLAFLSQNKLSHVTPAACQFNDKSIKLHPFSILPTSKSNKKSLILKHNKRRFFHGALIVRNKVALNPKQKFSIFKTCNYFLTVKFFTSLDSLILVYNIVNVSALFLYFRARIDKQVRPFFKKKALKGYFRFYDFSVYVKKRVTWIRQSYKERKEWWAKFRMKFFKRATYRLASLKVANMAKAPHWSPRRRRLPLPFVGSFLNKIFTKARRRWRRWKKDKRFPSLLIKRRRNPRAPIRPFRFIKSFKFNKGRAPKLTFLHGPFKMFRRVRTLSQISKFPKFQGFSLKKPSYKYRVPLYRYSNYAFPVYKRPSPALRSFFFRKFKPYRYRIHKFYIHRRGKYAIRRPSRFYRKNRGLILQRRRKFFKMREAKRLKKKALYERSLLKKAHV